MQTEIKTETVSERVRCERRAAADALVGGALVFRAVLRVLAVLFG